MASVDELLASLKVLINRLAIDGKRTAALTRLRIDLTGFDRHRRELYSKLGSRVDELRRTGHLTDPGMLGLLEEEFEEIDRVAKKIRDTMDSIQEITLGEIDLAETIMVEDEESEKPAPSGDLIDSFEVL